MEQDFEKIYNEYRAQSEQQIHARAGQADLNGKEEFVAVRKNDDGDLIAFKTNTGRELDYVTALDEAKVGNIAHIDVFHKYGREDRKSTRLNSSHVAISYAVFCLK